MIDVRHCFEIDFDRKPPSTTANPNREPRKRAHLHTYCIMYVPAYRTKCHNTAHHSTCHHKQILPNKRDVEILSHAMNHQNSIGSKSICSVFVCTAYIQRSIPQHSKTQHANNDDDGDVQQFELQYKPTQMFSLTICKLLCVSVAWQRKQEGVHHIVEACATHHVDSKTTKQSKASHFSEAERTV